MDYTKLTRPEILGFIRDQEKNLFDLRICPTPARPELILEITTKITRMMEALDFAKPITPPTAQKVDIHGLLRRHQSLRDIMRLKNNFNPGNDVNQFVTGLNETYLIHVTPDITRYPSLENEFVKAAKELHNYSIIEKMTISKQDIW